MTSTKPPVNPGFTLAELLIALAILGVIATFTIPKVLSSQQDAKSRAIVKESASALSGAYIAYKQQNGANTGMNGNHLTPYLNYISVESDGYLDSGQTQARRACSSGNLCTYLHNGSGIYSENDTFTTTDSTSGIRFAIDPDGKVTDGGTGDTSANAPGKSVWIYLYYSGRMTTHGGLQVPACAEGSCVGPITPPGFDPPWFAWN